ncbi:MAG: hypothetical protein ACE5KX_09155, partial [Acidimicrobiia bacterium]
MNRLSEIVASLISPRSGPGALPLLDVTDQFEPDRTDDGGVARSLNAAFLIAAAGADHPRAEEAGRYLARMARSTAWNYVAAFYREGLRLVTRELDTLTEADGDFAGRLDALADFLGDDEAGRSPNELTERMWSAFFPEGAGIRGREEEQAEALRRRRTIEVTALNPAPLTDPGRQVLFTANVLLTLPPGRKALADLNLDAELRRRLDSILGEPQLFWYDHPVQIGVEPEANELLYGLGGLDDAIAFEKSRRT